LESLQRDLLRSRGIEILLNSPIPLLGDATLSGCAGNDAKSLGVAAVLRYLECESSLTASAPGLLPKLFESLGLSSPPEPAPTSEELEDIPNDELNRVDVQNLDREGLVYLIQRSLQVSTTLVGRRASEALLALPDEGDDVSAVSVGEASAGQDADAISPAAAKMVAYSFLIQRGGTSKKILETIQQAKAHAEANEMSDASLLLAEASLHIRRGDGEAFQSCVQTITTKYGQNPEVMQRLQQMLIQLGLIRPDGRPAAPPPAASDSSSAGLWTPDSGSPAIPAPATSSPAAAAPASAAAPSGGSKLWVPGMD
ncbi:MAG: protein-disulfide isomerase, partial [Planctomycetota bacterium]